MLYTTLKLLFTAALIAAIAWYAKDRTYEPLIAIFLALASLIGTFVTQKKKQTATQNQAVSKSSVGIQAGGDIHIGQSRGDRDAK